MQNSIKGRRETLRAMILVGMTRWGVTNVKNASDMFKLLKDH